MGASLPQTEYVTPQELGAVLDVAGKAGVILKDAYQLSSALRKLIALASQPYPIGALQPPPEDTEQAVSELAP